MIRMNISPSPRNIQTPEYYKLAPGKGVTLRGGSDALIMSYGPVMLNEALQASELLASIGFGLEVVNMPWLNMVDMQWLQGLIRDHIWIYILEDHAPMGGLGDFLLHQMSKSDLMDGKQIKIFSVEGYPACGTPMEALKYHGLDGESLANSIKSYKYAKQSVF